MSQPRSRRAETASTLAVSRSELYTLLVGATRYALGRSTYVVGEMCDLLRRRVGALTPDQRTVIVRDISKALDEALRRGETLGMRQDDDAWRALLAELSAEGLS